MLQICKPLAVYLFYCMALYHSKTWRHVIKYNMLFEGPEVLNLVWVFIYIQTLCLQEANALVRLCCCPGSSELMLLTDVRAKIYGCKFKIPQILNFWNSNFKTCRMATRMDNLKLKWLCLDNLKTNQKSYYNLFHSAFWGWISMERQPSKSWIQN